jgi:hypothetical protein
MKQLILFFSSIVLIQSIGSGQSSWKSPDYKPEAYRKVVVLAKTSDELAKRQIEDATVKLLNDKGISAIPAYSNITAEDLATEDALIAKADILEVDALIVYTITGQDTKIKNSPSVSMGVGVPIRMGIFGGFLGGSVPIAGGAKAVSIVNANASFYNRSSKSMQWSYPLSGKLKKGTSKLAADFAKTTVNAMESDALFIK